MLKFLIKGIILKKFDENYMYVYKKVMKYNFKLRFFVLVDKKNRGYKVMGDIGNLYVIKLILMIFENISLLNWYDCIMGIVFD